MFTREHYEVIARAVRVCKDYWEHEPKIRAGVVYLAGYLSGQFQQDNPNFDAEKFQEACGIRLP